YMVHLSLRELLQDRLHPLQAFQVNRQRECDYPIQVMIYPEYQIFPCGLDDSHHFLPCCTIHQTFCMLLKEKYGHQDSRSEERRVGKEVTYLLESRSLKTKKNVLYA